MNKRLLHKLRSVAPATSAAIFFAVVLRNPVVAAEAAAQPAATVAPGQFWGEIDYLAWTVKGDALPALVTTSPAGTPRAQAGVLGAPGTTVLFGNSTVNDGWRSGGRLQAGYWFDGQRETGIEASFFDLESASTSFNASSSGNPILARPFLNASTNRQDSLLVAFPGFISGSVSARESSELLGAGALFRQKVANWGGARFDALVGYRYLRSADRLDIASSGTSDTFHAVSNFHGIDLGLAGTFRNGPWILDWRGKFALGANFNDSQIGGSTAIGGVTSSGGFLALSSNSGKFSQTRFAVVPALALKVGYEIAPQWQVSVGYDLIYWTSVQRAGGLVDTTINPNLLPPAVPGASPQRPQPRFDTSSLLAQGLSVGLKHEF